jgi:hypothetical protein
MVEEYENNRKQFEKLRKVRAGSSDIFLPVLKKTKPEGVVNIKTVVLTTDNSAKK